MPMDEVIRGIEQTDIENMQDVIQAAIKRYRELYPEWKILFLSAQVDATDEKSKAILKLVNEAEECLLYK
ncbi:MAG: hypothetical protein E7454_08230 [Ruminococcaceae bacterium]|nr:hypothetical protein [Oscillospiraceae bacterium]